MARFDNKVVLISGGARGQGAAEARLLVAEGAKVVIGDVREDEGKKLAAELGNRATFVRHDVTSEAEWAEVVAAAVVVVAAVVEVVNASNLRGRGGAGFPTGLKLTLTPKAASASPCAAP